jgi:hypothetical protein
VRSSDLAGATYFELKNSGRINLSHSAYFFLPLPRRKLFVDLRFFEFLRQRSDIFVRRPEALEPVSFNVKDCCMFHQFQSFQTFQSFDELRTSGSTNLFRARGALQLSIKGFFSAKPVEFLTVALSSEYPHYRVLGNPEGWERENVRNR